MSEEFDNRFKFTIEKLKALPIPQTGRVQYYDTHCRGLTVLVSSSSSMIFYRYGRVNGAPKRIRIGPFPQVTIEVARRACEKLTGEIAVGRDPHAERVAVRKQKTLLELWEHFRLHRSKGDDTKPGWKPIKRTWKEDESQWRRTCADWGHRKIENIKRSDVVARQKQLSEDGGRVKGHKIGGPGAGRKFIELLRALYSEAIIQEWTEHDPTLKVPINRPDSRDRFIEVDEIERFAAGVESLRTEKSRDFIWLALFTGARRSNVASMEWGEINWAEKTWAIPISKSKTKKVMVIHLPTRAVEILERRRNKSMPGARYVFPSTASAAGHYVEPKDAWTRVKQVSGLTDIRIHDLRRTLGSWQAERGESLKIIGESLGHGKKSTRTTEIYARKGKRAVRLAVEEATTAMGKTMKAASKQKKKRKKS